MLDPNIRTRVDAELRKCKETIKKMRAAMERQRNISADVKNDTDALEELLDLIRQLSTPRRLAGLPQRDQGTQTET